MSKPVLCVFAISHYCEKARWALDYLGIEYRLRHLAPGPHIKFARARGCRDGALPILLDGNLVLQGSGAIVDWAQLQGNREAVELPTADERVGGEIAQRLDDIIGVHLRRYYYSDALVTQPQTVKPMFANYLPWHQRLFLQLAWSRICQAMIHGMDLGAEQALESRSIVETELDWFDGLLADGRDYLLGGRFSRTDLCAASLLSPLALPPEHPSYGRLQVPPATAADLDAWNQRPALQWTREMYRRHRPRHQ